MQKTIFFKKNKKTLDKAPPRWYNTTIALYCAKVLKAMIEKE